MGYTKERVERLVELLERVKGRKEHEYAAPTYVDRPDLLEMEALILDIPDRAPETLEDTVAVLSFLADSYISMCRAAYAAKLYVPMLEAYRDMAAQRKLTKEELEDLDSALYDAFRARNHYTPDDCGDLMAITASCVPQERQQDLLEQAQERERMGLKNDPVEATEEYLAVIDEVEKLVKENQTIDLCFEYWSLKEMYLAQRGIRWRSPSLLNPGVMFD